MARRADLRRCLVSQPRGRRRAGGADAQGADRGVRARARAARPERGAGAGDRGARRRRRRHGGRDLQAPLARQRRDEAPHRQAGKDGAGAPGARRRRPAQRAAGGHRARQGDARRGHPGAGQRAEPHAARLLARGGATARKLSQAHARQRRMKLTLPVLAAAALVAGCASFKGIAPKGSLGDPAELKAEASLGDAPVSATWPELDWWRRFGDPQLDTLVEEALAGSANIRLARARIDQALAAAQIARAPLGPQLNATADVTRQRFSENYIFPAPIGGSSYTTTQLALSGGYDLDFWGRNRAAYEAALGRSRAAQAEGFAARLVLSSAVAGVYVQLARSFDQLDLARRELADREAVQRLTTDRVRAGLDSRLELKQVETSIPAARVRVAQMEEQVALARSQLAALLGKGPDRGLAIERPTLRAARVALPSRLPADLLGRRPDVVASRWRAEAAARGIASAKAQFYPDINLSP